MIHFDIYNLKLLYEELEGKMTEENFWDDPEEASKILKESKACKDSLEAYEKLLDFYEELEMMVVFIEEGESDFENDLVKGMGELDSKLSEMKIDALLQGEYDNNNAILSIHAGTGGLDAQEWTEMLLRMYTRWAENKGYDIKTLDLINDTEAGIKSATFLIEGINAYGYLKAEKGVHRLIRISPFDSSGKRHTSFASVDIIPEINDSVDIEINPNDLKIDTYRASGAGGQHVNKTDSAVRITHTPTGIVVQCQNQRSQHLNKERAMKMLISKLIEIKEREKKEKIEDLQGEYNQIAWGSQIRSYVFHPYTLVKDHRTNFEVGDIQNVIDGDIDAFITEYLKTNL